MNLLDLQTPALVLDRDRMDANIARMSAQAERMGVALRPHLKTVKSAAIARRATRNGALGITVSTLREAEYFAAHGARDIIYGVGIAPARLDRAAALLAQGVELKVMIDTTAAADAIVRHGGAFDVLIEIDCGDNRAGVAPDSPQLLAIANVIASAPRCHLRGVLTHAGHAYKVKEIPSIETVAEAERLAAVTAAERLRAAGYVIDIVSAGSTPTALFTRNADGLSELRAGVYLFFDLDQQSRGVCTRDDIALSVLATVIGHNTGAGKILLDAGGLALSKDTGATAFRPEVGYGEVCAPLTCRPLPGLFVNSVSQEHGHVSVQGPDTFAALPIGAKVRVLPNHACMTAAAYDQYHVVDGGVVVDQWERINGW